MLSNLLTNAMKFTKDRILVSLTENPEAHTVTISVEDNGTGIKPTEKEKIFNLFYQSANKPQLPNKMVRYRASHRQPVGETNDGKDRSGKRRKPVYPVSGSRFPRTNKTTFLFL